MGSFITESDNVPWKFRNRWASTLRLAKRLNIKISHISWERNYVADKLASLFMTPRTKKWWFGAPEDVTRLA